MNCDPAIDFIKHIEHSSKPEVVAARMASDPFEHSPDNPQREIFSRLMFNCDVSFIGIAKWLGVTLADASKIINGQTLINKKQKSILMKCTNNLPFKTDISRIETQA